MFGTCEQRLRIVRLDAAAVQQQHIVRRAPTAAAAVAATARAPPAPAAGVAVRPGADRPHRLVGDDRLREPRAKHRRATASSCRSTTASVAPASRSASVSPTQTIGVNPAASAAAAFAATDRVGLADTASAAPSARRSRTRQPNSASIAADTSPVYAPAACSLTFCAPQAIAEPDSAACACHRYGNGTHTASCAAPARRPARTQVGQQRVVLPQTAVHFPVADDEFAAHCSLDQNRSSAEIPAGPRYNLWNFTLPGPAGSTRCGCSIGGSASPRARRGRRIRRTPRRARPPDQTRARTNPRSALEQAVEVPPQRVEAVELRQRRLVHVQPAIDLDLQAVPALRRAAVLAHQLDALVRIVDRDVVAHRRAASRRRTR